MIFFLFITLTIILLACFALFHRDFCAPAFLLTIGFWASSLWAWLYQDHWNGFTNQSLYTIVVGGVTSFCAAAFIVATIDKGVLPATKRHYLEEIKLPIYKLQLYFVFEIIMFLITMLAVFLNVRSKNPIVAIGQYYIADKYNRLIYTPEYVKVIQYFNIAGVYLFEYVVMNNILCKKKNNKLMYIIVTVGLIISMLQGSRNTLFMFIISAIIMFYILKGVNTGWKPNLTSKTLIKMLGVIVLLVIFFRISIYLTGRSSDEYTFLEILSTYVGSPLKNLELFISEVHTKSSVWGGQTLMQSYHKLYSKTGNSLYNVQSLYTYRWIGTTGLGNVYTILMPLYQDFGMIGTWIMMAVIGAISQLQYDHVRTQKNIKGINFQILIYVYTSFAVVFSFFSNKYFETVVSMAFVYVLIGFVIIIGVVMNISIVRGKVVIHIRQGHHRSGGI